MGTCFSHDEVDKSISKFSNTKSFHNSAPHVFYGRIYPALECLQAPATGTKCVFYETKATTNNGKISNPDELHVKYHSLELRQVDFIISDSSNPLSNWMYIPASHFEVRVNCIRNVQMQVERPPVSYHEEVESVHKTTETANEHSLMWNLQNQLLVLSDDVLEIGQRVAILGIRKQIKLFSGDVVTVLTPVSTDNMTDDFYSDNRWSVEDKERWKNMTDGKPTFLISGKTPYFSNKSTPTTPSLSSTSPLIQFPGLEEINTAFSTRPEDLISYRGDVHTMSITPHPANEGLLSLHHSVSATAAASASAAAAAAASASAAAGSHLSSSHNSQHTTSKPKPAVHRPDRILRTSVDTTGGPRHSLVEANAPPAVVDAMRDFSESHESIKGGIKEENEGKE